MSMKIANIGEVKNRLSYYISLVEEGNEIEICKRNIPVAKIIPIERKPINKKKLGCGAGSIIFTEADLTEPLIPENDWGIIPLK